MYKVRLILIVLGLLLIVWSSWSPPVLSVAGGSLIANTRRDHAPASNDKTKEAPYYTMRKDIRRCAFPMCGGYFVSSLNQQLTRCFDGKNKTQCYVAEVNWDNQPAFELGRTIVVRGVMSAKTFPRFGKLGTLRVNESWTTATNKEPSDTFYRVRDLGVRCITHPCETHEETKLNSNITRKIAGVDLSAVGADEELLSQAHEALTGPEGIIIAGVDTPVTGPGGTSFTLKANQFYLRSKTSTSSEKPSNTKGCFRTGCSRIICADQEMVSTCEWKPEYECYRTARCERQSNGKCGWTQTQELNSCIASKRNSH